ncbi:hypothetical protein [Methanoplanus limicola]|jgi:hypothetical protein|uniref:Uncharacterized protein n=1 Tax=Methanoplanus limicola DSM 2279 TaxID=937775 RepID=H1Z2N2_9EURY|nr:hypothetical protein [Methanoplanus limicola]EHQ36435.1 hypothetical protein Metlim_2384 [Methanoplanus limicola DSM 2279]
MSGKYLQIRKEMCEWCGNSFKGCLKCQYFHTTDLGFWGVDCCYLTLEEAIKEAESSLEALKEEAYTNGWPEEMEDFRIIDYDGNPLYLFKERITSEYDKEWECPLITYDLVKIEDSEEVSNVRS